MFHKFKLGQLVRMPKPKDSLSQPAIVYEIVRLLPAEASGALTYRIKSGAIERAVQESEIQAVSASGGR